MRNTNVKNEKGITLIVLIITVVILFILAILVVDFTVDGKLFKTANELGTKGEAQQTETETLRNAWKNMLGLTNTIKNNNTTGNTTGGNTIGNNTTDENTTGGNTTGGDTPREDTIITIANCALKTITINSITVEAKATSTNEKDIISYELYTATTENGAYTKQGESISQEQNKTVELTASGLENYTVYYWYVKASSIPTVESSKTRTRTKCPGATSTETTITCTTCNGRGTATYTCNGGSRCSTCDSTGSIICMGTLQEEYVSLGSSVSSCCGSNYMFTYTCSSCGELEGRRCPSCGEITGIATNGITCGKTVKCPNCTNGIRPCKHGRTGTHDYTDTCTPCKGKGSITVTTTGCLHGQTKEHDELPEDAT